MRPEFDDEHLESITLEICEPTAKSFSIDSLHWPPNTSLDLFTGYKKCITKIDPENKQVIIIGDFNFRITISILIDDSITCSTIAIRAVN